MLHNAHGMPVSYLKSSTPELEFRYNLAYPHLFAFNFQSNLTGQAKGLYYICVDRQLGLGATVPTYPDRFG
jgi:hypothetical protein